MTRYILSFVLITACAVSSLSQASRNKPRVTKRLAPTSGASLGVYGRSPRGLAPQRVSDYEVRERIPSPGAEGVFYTNSSSKALGVGVRVFPSIASLEEEIRRMQQRTPPPGTKCIWKHTGPKLRGRMAVGKRFLVACDDGEGRILWGNGSVLFSLGGVTPKPHLKLSRASMDDLVEFEKAFPY